MLESMWSSMSSSMQLAQECLENEVVEAADESTSNMEGLEKFALTIDNSKYISMFFVICFKTLYFFSFEPHQSKVH